MRSCEKEPYIHIKRLSTMPLKIIQNIILHADSFFFISCFFNYLFIFIFKDTSESMIKAKLTLPDYMFSIMYFINNFKHLLLYYQDILKLIQVQNDHLTLNFAIGILMA